MTLRACHLVPVLGLPEIMTAVRTGLQWDVPEKSNIPRFEFVGNMQLTITIKYLFELINQDLIISLFL